MTKAKVTQMGNLRLAYVGGLAARRGILGCFLHVTNDCAGICSCPNAVVALPKERTIRQI